MRGPPVSLAAKSVTLHESEARALLAANENSTKGGHKVKRRGVDTRPEASRKLTQPFAPYVFLSLRLCEK
jgi:hypothetical protein